MLTNEQILSYLYHDSWFTPSKSPKKHKIIVDGKEIEVSESYYHIYDDIGQIVIRVSDHGTYLNTWVKHKDDPTISLQNLSVVFSNGPIEYSKKTEPRKIREKDGTISTKYIYFVVEQYAYRLNNLNEEDFKKVIGQVKKLDTNTVFLDPLRKKPSKKANRTPLTPNDINDNPIPSSTNNVHPRQSIVAANKDNEVDAFGNVLANESITCKISQIITETVNSYLKRECRLVG